MRQFTLVDVIEHEEGTLDLGERKPPTQKSSDWFAPHNREEFERGRPLVKALGNFWEKALREICNDPWTTYLQVHFGEDITPEVASELMTLFMWLGTNNGKSIVENVFRGRHALIVRLDQELATKHVSKKERDKVIKALEEIAADKKSGVILPRYPFLDERPAIAYNCGQFFAYEMLAHFFGGRQFLSEIPQWFEAVCGTTMKMDDMLLIGHLFRFICTPGGAEILNAGYKSIGWKPPITVVAEYA